MEDNELEVIVATDGTISIDGTATAVNKIAPLLAAMVGDAEAERLIAAGFPPALAARVWCG